MDYANVQPESDGIWTSLLTAAPSSQDPLPNKEKTWRISCIPIGISAQDLRQWLESFSENSTPDRSNIVQLSFAKFLGNVSHATVTFRRLPSNFTAQTGTSRSRIDGPNGLRVFYDCHFLGLTALYTPIEGTSPVIDVIAVSGLGGHPLGSWKSRYGPEVWLRDILPLDIPDIRVLLYGYDTDFVASKSKKSILDLALSFLEAVKTVRSDKASQSRPLVIIAHSLGGLVVKQALSIAARSQSLSNTKVFENCHALILFGVPNQGLRHEQLRSMVVGNPNEQLVCDLVVDNDTEASPFLQSLNHQFIDCFKVRRINVVCYYERVKSKTVQRGDDGKWARTGVEILMVTKASATCIGLPDELYNHLPVDADHSDMVKFWGPDDETYQSVVTRIKDFVQGIHLQNQDPLLKQLSQNQFRYQVDFQSQIEASISNLSSHVKQHVKEAHRQLEDNLFELDSQNFRLGSFDWFQNMPEYLAWDASVPAQCLWWADENSKEKTLLLQSLVATLLKRQSQDQRMDVVFHFKSNAACFSRETTRDSYDIEAAVLRSIICHLHHRDRSRSARGAMFIEKILLDNAADLQSLWKVLSLLFEAMKDMNAYIIIDGIDEMNAEHKVQFLQRLRDLRLELRARTAKARFLISCSPSQGIRYVLRDSKVIDVQTERERCLDILYFKELHARREKVMVAQENTSTWIWDHATYRKWVEKNSGLLWIQGKPGSGKSTLMKAIMAKLTGKFSSNSIVADFFYSARGSTSESSHKLMLRSLLYQLLDREPLFFALFQNSFRRFMSNSADKAEWSFHDLSEILLSLSSKSPRNRRYTIYILLDGMDESEDADQEGRRRVDVLSLMSELCSKNGEVAIKIIIASRPANTIEISLAGFHHIVMQRENQQDILQIVRVGLRSIWDLVNKCENDSDLTSDDDEKAKAPARSAESDSISSKYPAIRLDEENYRAYRRELGPAEEYLTKHAEGVILWVVLILSELKCHFERGYHTPQEIQEKLISLPTDLESTYQRIIDTLEESNADLSQARFMLMWASFAKRPLTVREFQDAVIISPDLPDDTLIAPIHLNDKRVQIRRNNWRPVQRQIVDICGSLVETVYINPSTEAKRRSRRVHGTDTVQLLHQTVKDFLMRDVKTSKLHFTEQDSHYLIANALLRYLKISLPIKDLKNKTIPFWNIEDYRMFVDHLEDRPLLDYAFTFLRQHVESSGVVLKLQPFQKLLSRTQDGHTWLLLEKDYIAKATKKKSNVRELFRISCMTTAIEAGHLQVLRLLLRTQEDLIRKRSRGRLPLDIARESGQQAVVDFLQNPRSFLWSWELESNLLCSYCCDNDENISWGLESDLLVPNHRDNDEDV